MKPVAEGSDARRSFIELLGDACLVIDEDMAVIAANTSAVRLYLRSPQELAGIPLDELCAEGHANHLIGEISSCSGTPRAFTAAQLRGDGTRFWADVTVSICPDAEIGSMLLLVREQLRGCRDELELRSLLLEECHDAMIAHTLSGDLVYANRKALAQWGCSSVDEMAARGPWGWVPKEEAARIAERSAQLQLRREVRFTSRIARPDGTEEHSETLSRLVDTAHGQIAVCVARDISDRVIAEEMVRHLAYHDNLTGLANRFLLTEELEKALTSAERHGDTTGLAYIDLDDFKPINDTMGHSVGDQALRIVAERISNLVRQSDTVARMGGDEFIVLLPRLSRPQDLPEVARKIAEEVAKPMRIGAHLLSVTVSVGLALHEPGESADEFTTRADLAMYGSRETGIPGWEIAWA